MLASANALPALSEDELRQQRLVTDIIVGVIKDVSDSIVEAGLDPVIIDESDFSFALSEPEIFSAEGSVKDFKFYGLSNIAINRINFSILSTRLTFDISLPRIGLRVGSSSFAISTFGSEFEVKASGSVAVIQPRLVGDVRASVGVISGISIRSLSLSFSLGGIESDVELSLFDRDISAEVNDFLGNTVPNTLKENAVCKSF
ncbi:unnamed protein product, partial [Iphiclides podalirius]